MAITHGASSGYVKVFAVLDADEWHGYKTESMWAEPVQGDVFVIRNVPFYAKGFSHEDTVRAPFRADERFITDVIRRSGHSTYRFILEQDVPESAWQKYWQPLEAAGCSYERADKKLFAVDVPPKADIHQVYALLEAGERDGVWGFEEGHCGHLLN